MSVNRLEYLYNKVIHGLATPEEENELRNFMGLPENETVVSDLIARAFAEKKDLFDVEEGVANRILHSVITNARQSESLPQIQSEKQIRLFANNWLRIAAVMIVFIGVTLIYKNKSTQVPTSIAKDKIPATKVIDIPPGTAKATLTLSGGRQIILDSVRSGQLASQGNTNIIKTSNGNILYRNASVDSGLTNISNRAISFNTLSTPRGGIYNITLPDGTTAWLNSASSITYPTRFQKSTREVFITGEVYFEVAHDDRHPFLVSLPAMMRNADGIQNEDGHWMQVEVLGTHFNINAYQDSKDEMVKTTLLEGSVKISANGAVRMIKPGQQISAAFGKPDLKVDDHVDLEKVMAWKNGEMEMSQMTVTKLFNEISRWYDVDVIYQGNIPEHKFSGSISRNIPLSSVLKALDGYGIKTELKDKRIIIF